MKRTITILIVSMILSVMVIGAEEAPTYMPPEEWEVFLHEISGFDELRLVIPLDYVKTAYRDGKAMIERMDHIRNHVICRVIEISDASTLTSKLEFDPKYDQCIHACHGLFEVWFFREGKLVGRFHYAHGRYWAALTERSQRTLTDWLVAHKLPIKKLIEKVVEPDASAR